MPKKEKVFTMPVIALILLSFALGTSEFIIVGILPDISEGYPSPLPVLWFPCLPLFTLWQRLSQRLWRGGSIGSPSSFP